MSLVGKINCPSCERNALTIDVAKGCAKCHECGLKITPEMVNEKYCSGEKRHKLIIDAIDAYKTIKEFSDGTEDWRNF